MPTTELTRTQEIIDRHERFMEVNLPRFPIAMVRGQGCRLWDAEGKEYLDLFAGFGGSVLGHCHPDLVDAVTKQANTLWHVGNLLHTEPQTLLAERIARHGFGGRSYFCHSGADANESAIKLARLHGKKFPAAGGKGPRYKVISMLNSFHGRSFSTMMATAQDKVRLGFEPWLEGFTHVPFNDLDAARKAVDDQTVAILVEPIQGEGGCNMPGDGYLAGLRKLCDEKNLILIFDEVWTGGGRTGRFFAHQHWNVVPDVMTLAKGVGGGLAVGVMCAGPRAWDYFDYRKHGVVAQATTLGGNCLSMAVAAKVFEVLDRDGLPEKAEALGRHVTERVNRFARQNPAVKEIRGKGLFLGIELNPAGTGGKAAWFKTAADVANKCLDRGILLNATQNTVLRLAPPLTVTREELDRGLNVIEEVIRGVNALGADRAAEETLSLVIKGEGRVRVLVFLLCCSLAQREEPSPSPLPAGTQGEGFRTKTNHVKDKALTRIAPIAILAVALVLTACHHQGSQRLPSLRDLRSTNVPRDDGQPATRPAASALLRRADLPLDASLAKAWAFLHTEGLNPDVIELWHANGLRVGVLEMPLFKEFAAALSPVVGSDAETLRTDGAAIPVHASAPLDRSRIIQLTQGLTASLERLPAGVPQFLVSLDRTPAGELAVTLTPHHHFVHASLVPRSPLEMQYDGRVFDELALHVDLRADQILVIAWSPSPAPEPAESPEPSDTQPSDEPPPPTSQPAATTDSPPVSIPKSRVVVAATHPAPPSRLGDILLTAARRGRPVQSLILLGTPERETKPDGR